MKFKKFTAIALVLAILSCFSLISVSAAEYTISDATDIQKHIAELITLSEAKQKEYDFNNDGVLSILDSTYLQMMLVNSAVAGTTPTVATETKATTSTAATEPSTLPDTTEPSESATTPIVTEPTEPSSVSKPTEPAESSPVTEPTQPTTIVYPSRLELNKTTLTLGVGEQYTLVKDTDVPDYPFMFVSGNNSVATVDGSGKVTAICAGTVFVACTSENGLTALCCVTVKDMAQSVTLNKSSLTLGIGETFDLDSFVPSGTAAYYRAYSSNNSDIAPVVKNSGVVTAVKQGSAVITCLLNNGVTATCTVTVKAAPTSATLSVTSKQLKVGENYTITASANSGAYSYNSSWSSSNTQVATVEITSDNQAQISPKMPGTTTITFKTYNGKTASCTVTVQGSNVKCLDVSFAQGNIDFTKVKAAGYDYVIIRAGYGNLVSQKDSYFEQNYNNAKAAGLKVGAYWYSYSTTYSDSLKEADACLSCISGKSFDLPIYYDVEEQAQAYLSKTTLTNMIDGFCSRIESYGYSAGVYATNGMYWNIDKATLKTRYSTWLAQIDGDFSTITDDVHQYTWTQIVPGISTYVDCNYIYNLNIVK